MSLGPSGVNFRYSDVSGFLFPHQHLWSVLFSDFFVCLFVLCVWMPTEARKHLVVSRLARYWQQKWQMLLSADPALWSFNFFFFNLLTYVNTL